MKPRIVSALVAIAGVAVIALAFLPWLYIYGRNRPTFYAQTIDGDDVKGLTGFGDGHMTAMFGAVAALAAVLTVFVPSRQRIIAPLIATTGLLITGLALYDTFLVRQGSKYFPEVLLGSAVFDVNAGIALWATLALGIIVILGGLLLLVLSARARNDAPKTRYAKRNVSHSEPQRDASAESHFDAEGIRSTHETRLPLTPRIRVGEEGRT